MVPHHGVFVGCEPDPKCFRRAKVVLLRQFSKALLCAGTDLSLSGEGTKASHVFAGLAPELAAADLL